MENYFRHEYGRLVAVLTRKVGVPHLEHVEDAVQAALTTALTTWVNDGPPTEPGAWLYRVAWHNLLGELRKGAGRSQILARPTVERDGGRDGVCDAEPAYFEHEVHDDVLRMLFVCCDEVIPRESRLVLALKTLCGFSVEEIALRLFTTDTNVYKRLARARQRLREAPPDLQTPSPEAMRSRVADVHAVLYLLFNEGYLSAQVDETIRRDLCDEAIRLTTLLAEHTVGAVPETFALLALMHLHAARFAGRVDASGGLLLLEEQDRSLWDVERLRLGAEWLERSASGDTFSRFHAEAGIAAEHGFARSFRETRWQEIAELYALLEAVAPSPLHTMNRALAVAEWQGPAAGLAVLVAMVPPGWLQRSYLWDAVLADLHQRVGKLEVAAEHRERALAGAPSDAVRDLMSRRLTFLGASSPVREEPR